MTLPADLIASCGAMIKSGKRNIDIARELGIHPQCASRYRKLMGAGAPDSILGPKIIADVDRMPITEVAKKWGCSRQHVYNLLHKAEGEGE